MIAFKTTTRFLVLAIFITGLAIGGCGRSKESESFSLDGVNLFELDFAKNIVLGSEYGGDGRCTRFVRSPKISLFVFDSDVRSRGAFNQAVSQINSALTGTGIQLRVSTENDESAEIKVFFAALSSFSEIARRFGIGYVAGNTGFFQTAWNGYHEITSAQVMIASDQLPGQQIYSVILEELTQALGFGKDQAYLRDSIFYETSMDPGFALSYGALDAKLIRFFYRHVAPGDGERELTKKFARYWNGM